LKKNKVYEFPIKINSSNLRDFLNPKKERRRRRNLIINKKYTISSSSSLNDGLLKEIAENTKKTNEEVGRLADNFTVFSKMLPGALSNNSRSSESQPIIVNKNSKVGMGNKIRSAQIAKSGNPEIQNFRTIVENIDKCQLNSN
jgi:hypothetical protein